MSKRILLLASGAGSLAEAILTAHHEGEIAAEFVGLISDKPSRALEVAKNFGVAEFYIPMQPDRAAWDKAVLFRTQELKPDLVVSVGFMRVLAPRYVADFRVINSHPSLLPKYPGAHAVRDALRDKAEVTGTTIHWVDAGLDTGAVITQQSVQIQESDDEDSLHERIKIVERALIVEVLAEYGRTGKL